MPRKFKLQSRQKLECITAASGDYGDYDEEEERDQRSYDRALKRAQDGRKNARANEAAGGGRGSVPAANADPGAALPPRRSLLSSEREATRSAARPEDCEAWDLDDGAPPDTSAQPDSAASQPRASIRDRDGDARTAVAEPKSDASAYPPTSWEDEAPS